MVMEPIKCPDCGENAIYDEVDIGVGTMIGNVHCDACGWSAEHDLEREFE